MVTNILRDYFGRLGLSIGFDDGILQLLLRLPPLFFYHLVGLLMECESDP